MKLHDLPRVLWILAILLLVAAVARHSYGYYEVLHSVVAGVAVSIAIAEFLDGRSMPDRRLRAWAWAALFLLAAVLFNPIDPVHLRRGTWFYLDLTVAFGFFAHFFVERQGIVRMRK